MLFIVLCCTELYCHVYCLFLAFYLFGGFKTHSRVLLGEKGLIVNNYSLKSR